MTTTPDGLLPTSSESVDQVESLATGRGSVVDQTGAALSVDLQLDSPQTLPSKRRSTVDSFIEAGGDDPRFQDLL